MEQEKQLTSLPENAYRELAPGEEYTPMLPASAAPAEVTPYSVGMGIVMAVVFSAAAAYLGLKIGQVFEAAIPIAIIAVGMGSVLGKRNMLGQNVIIQSIGASSGVIVAGAIFTLPALYILGLDAAFYQIFLSSLFGGLLGIVLLIPFRSYFVKEMHGKYPFPEATATTEVLVSGEKGGAQAKLLAVAGAVGGLYDFVVSTFGAWTESVSTRICDFGAMCADKFKVVFGLNTGAAVLGLHHRLEIRHDHHRGFVPGVVSRRAVGGIGDPRCGERVARTTVQGFRPADRHRRHRDGRARRHRAAGGDHPSGVGAGREGAGR